jgi:hypothetical protein
LPIIDGIPLPTTNPNDRQKLIQATLKYKNAVDSADQREKAARVSLGEAKSMTLKQQAAVKQAQRVAVAATANLKKRKFLQSDTPGGCSKVNGVDDNERASARVQDIIGALSLTADKRRDQLNQKRNSGSSSTWVQTLPGLPGPLRKSLWYKMHRRRQQIVLRPSLESLVSDLREHVAKRVNSAGTAKNEVGDELLKAEQMLLLAMHPVASEGSSLSSVPSSSSWAEPGT